MGLTGLILWAEIRVRRVAGPFIAKEQIRFRCVDEFFEISADSDERFEHTMAWVDCLATGKNLGRGLFMRGNYTWPKHIPRRSVQPKSLFTVPVQLPAFALNLVTAKAFNNLYYRSQLPKHTFQTVPYDPFFYPLDALHEWHRLYGPPGFLQYQFVIPDNDETDDSRRNVGHRA